MNILLTGGSGFIGRNIRESRIADKHKLLSPPHRELELLDEDNVRNYLKQNSINIIIHSAIKPGHRNANDHSNLVYNNTRMFFNLVRNEDFFDKFIFLGSGSVYDMRHYQPRMKEDYFDTHVPIDDNGFSKYVCSKYISKMSKGIDLRIFGIFGKYEDYSIRFISNMICKSLFNLPLTMNQNRRFDYLYIDDLIPILEYFIENDPRHRAYNVTPDKTMELHSLARHILTLSGKNLSIKVREQGMGMEYSGDNLRLREEIPTLECTDVHISVERLFGWYRESPGSIDINKLLIDK